MTTCILLETLQTEQTDLFFSKYVSCQHDGNIVLLLFIMYTLCHIYSIMGNMEPYKEMAIYVCEK